MSPVHDYKAPRFVHNFEWRDETAREFFKEFIRCGSEPEGGKLEQIEDWAVKRSVAAVVGADMLAAALDLPREDRFFSYCDKVDKYYKEFVNPAKGRL